MMARDTIGDAARVPAAGARLKYPCSSSQLRFWFEELRQPRNPGLNVAVRWRLDGTLSHAILEEAWRRIVQRHEPLRTSFLELDGEPVQIVAAQVPFSVLLVDLRGLPEPEREREANRLADREARTPFDVISPPLIRVTRLLVSDESSTLLVTAHHTVCDGWSIGVLAREMGSICAALHAGMAPLVPDLPLRFGEYAAWERAQTVPAMLAAERTNVAEMLRGFKQFELLTDRPRPRRLTSNGAIESILLDRTLTNGLAELARSNGCTFFMTALAALFTLFHRYTGEDDIVIGTQVTGRDEEDLEKLVGCFINTIALRADLSADPDFLTLLDRTRDMVSDAFENRRVPLQQLIEIAAPVRDASRNAVFSINFIFQRSFISNETYGSFALVDLPSRSAGALYDANFFMVERPEGWRVSCEYNTDLFDRETIARLLQCLRTLFESIAADPTEAISTIAILPAGDRDALVVAANQTQAAYPADTTLSQRLSEQAARTPHATAVRCGDTRLTYAQLDAAVSALARELAEQSCEPGERIGVLLGRSTEVLVAMLAVLRAGCAYVPLDPKFPRERLNFIAQDSRLAAVITHPQATGALDTDARRVCIGDPLASPRAGVAFADRSRPDGVAYVIYTSGSTGRPKGVQIAHRALTNFLFAMRERPGMTAGDILVAVTTVSFDIAALELFLPLVAGAQVVIARESEVNDGEALAELIRRSGATVVQATPATWQLLVDSGWDGAEHLKILCGGEALSRPLAEALLDRCAALWNMYGPTETTIWSGVTPVTLDGGGPIPIGPPIANTQFYVLDRKQQLVPPGVAGELFIGGDGVALGYFGREDLTRERFVDDPFRTGSHGRLYRTGDVVRARDGGCYEFLGRTDHQIKLRGFRIELEEITAALLRVDAVAEAVTIALANSRGDTSIRAFVAPHPSHGVDRSTWPGELRTHIASFLPAYMLPAAIAVVDELPRTPNGKIDRNALVHIEFELAPAADVRPSSETEQLVAAIAQELTGRKHIARDADLFSVGLHSLAAVNLIARIANSANVRLSIRHVFDAPSISGIAQAIDALRERHEEPLPAHSNPIVAINAGSDGPPLIFFHSDAETEGMYCRRLAAAVGADRPFFAVAPHGSAGLPVLTSIEEMARDYLPRLKAVQPHGPYQLGGHCNGGIVAFEVARLLRAQGDDVRQLVISNAYAPNRSAIPVLDAIIRRIGLDETRELRVREKMCFNVARLAISIDKGPAALLRFLAVRLATAFRLRERDRKHVIAHPDILNRRPGTPDMRRYFAHMVAGFTYHPKPCHAAMTLIWSSGEAPAMGDPTKGDPTMGWASLTDEVRVIPMPGGHNAPIQERVDEFGTIIASVLTR